MKIVMLILLLTCVFQTVSAQKWDELFRQRRIQRKYLLLQIAKLQVYLKYVKNGYKIANKGLTLIGNIKDGDIKLHELFFENKKRVKVPVRDYSKVQEIYTTAHIIQSNFSKLHALYNNPNTYLSERERDMLDNVRLSIISELNNDIESLNEILSWNELEMSDAERLKRIDNIYMLVRGKKMSTQELHSIVYKLTSQRKDIIRNNNSIGQMYGF